MSEKNDVPLYRIKGLEWQEYSDISWRSLSCEINYFVRRNFTGAFIWSYGREMLTCDSINHGKQLCQKHWEEYLTRFLTKAVKEPCDDFDKLCSNNIPLNEEV